MFLDASEFHLGLTVLMLAHARHFQRFMNTSIIQIISRWPNAFYPVAAAIQY